MTPDPLSPALLARLHPPDRLTVAEWANRYRVLDPTYSPGEPGPYSWERTPYIVGVWEAWQDPHVRQITWIKSTQIGGTEALMNMLGHTISEDPGPIMLVMPTGDDAREMRDRVAAMVDASPHLAQFAPRDKGDDLRTQIRYGATQLYLRGSESPRQLARVAAAKVVVDEADKTPISTAGGREAGAIQLVRHRLRTVLRSKLYVNSTPSTRAGPIWQEWERSDQRYYHVPCPACSRFQRLEFSQIRWPEGASADEVERDKSATYHCVACDRAIDPYREKAAALAGGRWVASRPKSEHAGFHISALYSPWLTWSQIAVEHLRAVTVQQRQDFVNGYLGWIFEEQVDRIDETSLRGDAATYQSGQVPDGVRVLTCGVDCGRRDVHYEVRGWGLRGETWLIEAGRIGSTDLKTALLELAERVLLRTWGEAKLTIRRCFVDSGYKPATVARFCRRHRVARAVAGKDENPGRVIIRPGTIEKTIAGRVASAPVLLVDTNEVKDQIADSQRGDGWHVPADTPDDWFRHMAAEHAINLTSRGRTVKRWQPLPGGGANHWLDAAVYSFAAGYSLGAWTLQDELAAPKRETPGHKTATSDPQVPPMRTHRPPRRGFTARGGGFSARSGFRLR